MSTDQRARLARLMDERRAELGLGWEDVASAGGVSVATLRRVRSGAALTTENSIAIERGLRWGRGSVTAILDGGDPVELGAPARQAGGVLQEILDASAVELVRMFSVIENSPDHGRDKAERWLIDAIELREARLRKVPVTKRDVS